MSPVPEDERDFEMEVEESSVVYVPPVQAIAQSVYNSSHNVPDSIDLQNYRCGCFKSFVHCTLHSFSLRSWSL